MKSASADQPGMKSPQVRARNEVTVASREFEESPPKRKTSLVKAAVGGLILAFIAVSVWIILIHANLE